MSGLITGVGSERYSILCYWLIPNRNTKDGIRIVVSWVQGSGVKGTESLYCGSNGRVILGRYFDGCIGCCFAGSGGGGDGGCGG